MPSTHHADEPQRSQPVAALLAFAFPGLGHIYLGRPRRGLLVALGVLSLFFGGLLIAGIGAVDSGLWYATQARKLVGKRPQFDKVEGDPVWFLGEMFVGPLAFGVDLIHQYHFKVLGPGMYPKDPPVVLRTAQPYEIRNPRTGEAIKVRDPMSDPPNQPLQFVDPVSGTLRMSTPADRPPYVKPLERVAEVGTLFCTIAGMLNLIAIIDCSWSHRGPEPEKKKKAPQTAPPGAKP